MTASTTRRRATSIHSRPLLALDLPSLSDEDAYCINVRRHQRQYKNLAVWASCAYCQYCSSALGRKC